MLHGAEGVGQGLFLAVDTLRRRPTLSPGLEHRRVDLAAPIHAASDTLDQYSPGPLEIQLDASGTGTGPAAAEQRTQRTGASIGPRTARTKPTFDATPRRSCASLG